VARDRTGTFRPGSSRAGVPGKRRPSRAKAGLAFIGETAELVGPVDLSDVLSEFARTMVTDFPVQGILDRLVKRIVDVLPVTAAGVTLISADLDPRYVAASNESALRFEELQGELGEGPCLAAYHTGEAISVPDLSAGEWFPTFSPRALDAGLAAENIHSLGLCTACDTERFFSHRAEQGFTGRMLSVIGIAEKMSARF